MIWPNLLRFIFWITISLLAFGNVFACSGYKITIGNKTLLGSNEDAWRVTPRIWFESGTGKGRYGAAFTGSRYDGENGYAPQAGMNEMGLAFERLASYHPKSAPFTNRIAITNPTRYLKEILHTCKTIDEVKAYVGKYDHSYFIEDVFIYVDKSGKYLVVEPYSMTMGNEPTYVISNFCPSITSAPVANQLERYRNGVDYLKHKIDTTLEFCTNLSDTMHVCRDKIGDGTLLTTIWDLQDGIVNLYFYHQYHNTVQFNIKDELKKGDHIIAIETLFPYNPEFEKLRNYKTPKNNHFIRIFMVAAGGLFLFTSFFFLMLIFIKNGKTKYAYIQWLLIPLGLILFYYMYVLSTKINVFYFSAPYKDPANVLVSLSSYLPFLLLLIIIPLCVINYRLFQQQLWGTFAKVLFSLNILVYIMLIGLFVYWGFYSVFHI